MKIYKSLEEWQDAAFARFGRMPMWAFGCPKCGSARTIWDTKQQGGNMHEAYLICPTCGYTARKDGICDAIQRPMGGSLYVFPLAPIARQLEAKGKAGGR